MRNQNATSGDDIDLASIGRALKRSLPKLLLLSAVTGGLTMAVMSTMAPQFASTATIEINSTSRGNPLNPNNAMPMADPGNDPQAIATHVRKMLSSDIALRMNKDLALSGMPEFNGRLPPNDLFSSMLLKAGIGAPKASETDEDRVLAAYYKALKVSQIRETRSIQAEFTSTDAKFSATAANKLVELYRDSLLSSRVVETSDVVQKVKAELDRITIESAGADQAVSELRAKVGQINTAAGNTATLSSQEQAEILAESTKASTARSEAESRAFAAKTQMAAGTAESNPDVQKSQLIPRLSEQRVRLERQVSELATTLMPAHPRMRQVQGELASLQRQIKEEVRKVVDGLEREAKTAIDRETAIKARMATLTKRVSNTAPDEARLKALEDVAKAKRTELERLNKAYEQAKSDKVTGGAPIEAKIVQKAFPKNEKVFPKPGFFGPLVALATLMMGLAFAVTREIIRGPRGSAGGSTPGDGRIRLDTTEPMPREAPALAASSPLAAAATASVATAMASADIGLRPGVKVATPDGIAGMLTAAISKQGALRTLISGDRVGTDAAMEAVALAKAMGAADKNVVLVDWAQSGSDLSQIVGGMTTPGMAQLILGDAAFEDVIQKLADTEVQFIPAGDAGAEPSIVFDADRANLVLDALDEAYEHIVVYASHTSARALFEATQGRFDAGVIVVDGKAQGAADKAFLGFDVPDMDLFRIERAVAGATAGTGGRKSMLPRGGRVAEARA